MQLKACLRCASLDLRLPGSGDGVALDGGQLLSSTCQACGLTSGPVIFSDMASYDQFRAERAALYQAPEPPQDPYGVLQDRPRGQRRFARGVAGIVGAFFLLGGLFALLSAARVGGDAWGTLGPSALISLLLGVPMLAFAWGRD